MAVVCRRPTTESEAATMWSWRYEDAHGNELKPEGFASETFVTQADAETWLGETWRELLDAGVDQVTLYQGNSVEYGPMSLHPDT